MSKAMDSWQQFEGLIWRNQRILIPKQSLNFLTPVTHYFQQ